MMENMKVYVEVTAKFDTDGIMMPVSFIWEDGTVSFDRHLQKILKLLNMTVEDLMLYHSAPSKLSAATVYSQNAPMDHEMNDTAKKQYNLLLDVIELCAIYY